jgi:hypothetical protein
LSNSLARSRLALKLVALALLVSGLLAAAVTPAVAVPIFAERYGFSCATCHSVVPELNPFGEAFRRAGFQLPKLPRHREFPLVLRFQESYMKDLPPAQSRRFNALAILVSTANFGPQDSFSYFARYLFGSQGAPGSLYYGYLQHVAANSGVFERAGLYNLPLIVSATQRLDTFTPQSAYTYTVGHDSANFTTPRWGAMFGQRNDKIDAEVALSFDEYHGAAYGAPTPPSDLIQTFVIPEIFASATFSLPHDLRLGVLRLAGSRNFRSQTNGAFFSDRYYRDGIQGQLTAGRFDLIGQQLWGHDDNADGFGNGVSSSGGFLTLKYRPTSRSYVGVRYDAEANPFATRDWDFYAAFAPTVRSRILVEFLKPINQPSAQSQTNAQLLFALPDPKWVK